MDRPRYLRRAAFVEPKGYILGQHLVAFLDVLGQREKFRGLRLPTNAEQHAQVAETLRQTAGFVVRLREVYRQQFDVFEAAVSNIRARTQGSLRPGFMGFSDSFVTFVPLRKDFGHLAPVASVFSALSAACVVMLTSLASKHPLRGGIDVGFATEIGPEEIYGTALERAYLLECETAKYPRIVIGDHLWSYLRAAQMEFEKGKTPEAKAITGMVHLITRLIATDSDGKRILDYLGEVMVQHSGPDHVKQMIRPSYQFVLAEQNRIATEGNTKLAAGYVALRNYVESRLPLWGISLQTS